MKYIPVQVSSNHNNIVIPQRIKVFNWIYTVWGFVHIKMKNFIPTPQK